MPAYFNYFDMKLAKNQSLKVIETDNEYQEALDLIKVMLDMGDEKSIDEENYLEVLSILIEKYEEESGNKVNTSQVDAVAVLNYYLTENNLQQKGLIPMLGPASRVSEIMNRKRKLNLKQIKRVNEAFKIPVRLLID
jgi:HTH-type transcriptional regulator/antitoxin HigA